MVFTMLAMPVVATDIEDGSDTAYVKARIGSMNCSSKNPTSYGRICCSGHPKQQSDGFGGLHERQGPNGGTITTKFSSKTVQSAMCPAYAGRKDTLEAAEDFEEKLK